MYYEIFLDISDMTVMVCGQGRQLGIGRLKPNEATKGIEGISTSWQVPSIGKRYQMNVDLLKQARSHPSPKL